MIVVDCIALQTASKDRGIGRYTRNLVGALHDAAPARMVALARRRFGRPLGLPYGITVLPDAPPSQPDWLLVSSAFEWGAGYEAPEPHPERRTAAILYDLIPLHWPDRYLAGPDGANYRRQLDRLRRYDLLLAISEAVRLDAIERLGVAPDRVVTIGGAHDPGISLLPGTLPAGLMPRFVLSVLTCEHHKNAVGLVRAFGGLPPDLRTGVDLVVVTSGKAAWMHEAADEAARARVPLRVLDRVDDGALAELYRRCAAFAMPSLYEGFGLPALEAMACGAPVIAGANSAQVEVVGDGGLLVDLDAGPALCAAIGRVLTEPELAARLREAGVRRAAEFRWPDVARRALAALLGRP